MKKLNITFVMDALLTGGAETFALRLASSLKNRGHSVDILVLHGNLIDYKIARSIAPHVSVIGFNALFRYFFTKMDGLLYLLGVNFSFIRYLNILWLRNILVRKNSDVVHSHLMTADIVSHRACRLAGSLPWISTMHGDYISYENSPSRAARILNFKNEIFAIERSVSNISAITDFQLAQLRRIMPTAEKKGSLNKIYNGYSLPNFSSNSVFSFPFANALTEKSFVVGMVSRGIVEKGWDVLFNAFDMLDMPDAFLLLVGDGPELTRLKSLNTNERIIFVGSVVDPLNYIQRFDVCCLPSWHPTESLPTVVIEYLVMGKPVIASDIGEISRMIDADTDHSSGLLIPVGDVPSMTQNMAVALQRLYESPVERTRMAVNALRSAEKFDMDRCVDAYLEVYRKALHQ